MTRGGLAGGTITDVPGITVGHFARLDPGWATGTTVLLVEGGAVGGVDCRGGAPGTRETDLLAPENLVQRVHAVCLSGGSAYGLAAADGVMRLCGERGIGLPVGAAREQVVPIVPAAVLFDLPRSAWGNRPDAEFGYRAAAEATGGAVPQGSVGAGTGAVAGSLKGGLGTASAGSAAGHTVGALAVTNARGEAVNLATGAPYARDAEWDGEFGLAVPGVPGSPPSGQATALNTTIGVVATDAALSKAECRRLAGSAHDGLARAVRPAHSIYDGDTVFALATGDRELDGPGGATPRAWGLHALCAAAAEVFARAVVHGVLAATAAGGVAAYRDLWPGALADPSGHGGT